MAELRATPYANPLTGLSNDAIQGLLAFMQNKRRTQQLQGLGNLLESTGIPKTIERAAYAESPRGLLDALTNVNRANVPFLKPETAEAAMTLAPIAAPVNRALMQATKGLPVGASIKNVGKFDVVKRDASDIFGEGAQRIRYTDPKSNGSIEVLARPDGTASVLSLEVPEKFRGKKIGESLQKQVLDDFPDMQGQVSSKAAATTAYRLGRRPVDMPDATLKDVHKMIDEDSSVNMISSQMQQRIKPFTNTEYPLAPAGTRYEEFGGELTYMTPDEYLSRVRPLTLDEESLDNIAALKSHVQSGGQLDPLHIYQSGVEDGRHRAYMAKELGIEKIPVALHTEANNLGQNIPLDALSLLAEQQRKKITSLLE